MKFRIFLLILICISLIFSLIYSGIIWLNIPDQHIFQVQGLDVSDYQREINWTNLDPNYKFVFIKATEGDSYEDKYFERNKVSVKQTNLIYGAYHFYNYDTDGISQAKFFIEKVENSIDLPPVLDIEGNFNLEKKSTIIEEIRKCIGYLENHYHKKVIIYVTEESFNLLIKNNFDNPLWYRSIIFNVDKSIPNLKFWQFHNRARVNGISEKVDLNVFYGSLEELKNL